MTGVLTVPHEFGHAGLRPLGETALLPSRPLAAWPQPYAGGELHVSFAVASPLGGGTAHTEVALYDLAGRRVRSIASGAFAPGTRAATWNGRDEGGHAVSGGIYFLRLTSAGQEAHTKIVVLE